MREHKYILVHRKPVPEPDLHKWSLWMEGNLHDRHIGYDEVEGGIVSTVFLGVDRSLIESSVPLVFETCIFQGEAVLVHYQTATWDDARKMHEDTLAKVRGHIAKGEPWL